MKFLYSFYLFIILILFSDNILAQTDQCIADYSKGGYQFQGNHYHSINIGFGKNFGSGYLLELNWFPITWVSDDPFNSNKVNFSFPIIPIVFMTTFPSNSYSKRKLKIWEIVGIILNSKHHLFIFGEYNCTNQIWPGGFSILFKNNIDWFCFRTKQWLNISPGLGFGIFYSRPNHLSPNISFNFGVSKNISTRFSETKYDNIIFLEISIMGRND